MSKTAVGDYCVILCHSGDGCKILYVRCDDEQFFHKNRVCKFQIAENLEVKVTRRRLTHCARCIIATIESCMCIAPACGSPGLHRVHESGPEEHKHQSLKQDSEFLECLHLFIWPSANTTGPRQTP